MPTKEVEINGESLEVLSMLANSRRPMGYIEFVARPERNLLVAVLDLIDLGIVKRTDPHTGQVREDLPHSPYGERESFYELTERGRGYFNRIIGYASQNMRLL